MTKRLLKCLVAVLSLTCSLGAAEVSQPAPVVILGGGIGALTSAIYLQRAGVQSIVIEGQNPGGAIAQSPHVQNWPGEIEIDGQSLIEKVRNQAEVNGAKILNEEAISVDFSKRPFKVTTREILAKDKQSTLLASSVIIATGSAPKLLGVEGESDYWAHGVYTCATCDGSLFKNQIVAVIGGGDTAILEAEYLSKIAKKVYIVVRSKNFRTSETLRKQLLLKHSNVEVLYDTKVEKIEGDGSKVTSLVLNTPDKQKKLEVNAVFLAIGSTPNTRLFQGQLDLDNQGYIVLKDAQQTSQQGIYAIGDVVDPVYKQAISAAGDGAKAALQVERELGAVVTVPNVKEQPKLVRTAVQKIANNESALIELSSPAQLLEELSNTSTPVLVDFYSPYCGPCRKIAPQIKQAATSYAGKIKFLKANISELNQLTSQYNLIGVPTVIVFNTQGKEIDRRVGPDQINSLLNSLDNLAK